MIQCPICKKYFKNDWGLTVHQRKKHKNMTLSFDQVELEAKSESTEHEEKPETQVTTREASKNVPKTLIISKEEDREMQEISRELERAEHTALEERFNRRMDQLKHELEKVNETFKDIKSWKDSFGKEIDAKTKSLVEKFEDQLVETQKHINGLSSAQSEIQKVISDEVKGTLKKISQKVEELPTEEKVKELVSECLADPNGEACKRLATVFKEVKAIEEEPSETEGATTPHKTAKEFLECPTCSKYFNEEIKKRIGQYIDDETIDSVLDIIKERGVKVEKEEKEKKEKPKGETPIGF